MIAAAVALGLLIGVSLGALGGGGSILTVPALVFVLGLTAQQATAGSLVIVGVTALIASIGHARAGNTRWGNGTLLAIVGIPASLLGSKLNRDLPASVLLLAFAALMAIAAAGMLRQARPEYDEPEYDEPEYDEPHHDRPGASVGGPGRSPGPGPTCTRQSAAVLAVGLRLAAAGLAIGLLTGFLGVGGGFIIVPALVLLLGYALPVAVGTSLLVIALNSAVALAARLGHEAVVWHVVLPFTVAAIASSLAGKRVADRVDAATLTRSFAVLLLVVAAFVGIKAGLGAA